MAHIIRIGRAGRARIVALAAFLLVFCFAAFGQMPSCNVGATSPTVHAEGLAEQIGDITLTCSGGSGNVNASVVVALNATVTNRLEANGSLTNVSIAGAGVTSGPAVLDGADTVLLGPVQFAAGASVSFTIGGIRVAMPTVSGGGAHPIVKGSVVANQLILPNAQPLLLAVGAPTLLSSVLNYGVPCAGSPSPSTIDFPGLIAAGTSVSTIRITEANAAAFAPKTATADFGVRFLVRISGYGPNATVFVPDVIVGNLGTAATAAGGFGPSQNGGTYTPGLHQLLLTRVSGADATGAGGDLVLPTTPGTVTSFTSVSQLTPVNGAAFVVYEVLDANPSFVESAQIPVFVALPATRCATLPENTLGATLAPASTVSIPTQTDPIPRYIATTPGSDCAVIGDCSAPYFPVLRVDPPSITLNGSSLGPTQTAFITIANGGSNQLTFNVSTAYQPAENQPAANWLMISATSGAVGPAGSDNFVIDVSASPAAPLAPGAYQATVTVDAGSAGTLTVPVTFNVGPAGPVIQSVVNAANSQPGPITAGSFATIYGVNLVKKTSAIVTFDGYPATISYDGQPSASSPAQINVLVPAELSAFANAGITATIDGVASNTYVVKLVPNAPAVFTPGILNQDSSVNLATAPASPGDIIQIFLTGLSTPVTSPLTVMIGTQSITGSQIIYAGSVPSIPGLEQVNVQVPGTLIFSGNSVPLSICIPGAGQQFCSAPVNLYLH